jgi:hypothetical protein
MLKQPICLSSIAATAGCGMVEFETILAPVTFGAGEPTRFLGMVQILTDVSALAGKPIAFERLVGSQLVREDEPFSVSDTPPPPSFLDMPSHPRAPHLRLVVSRDRPSKAMHFDSLREMLDVFGTGISLGA